MSMKSVKYNFLMNSILTASSLLFPLITFPYISHILQADAYGSVSFVQSVMSYFTMVASLGIPTYGIRACAKVRDNKLALSQTVLELFLINEVITIVCTVFYVGMIFFIPRIHSQQVLFWLYSPVLLLNATGMNWLYSAVEEYRYITVRSLAFKIVSLLLTLLFVKSSNDLNLYVAILTLATVGPNLCNIWNARKIIFFSPPKRLCLTQHIRPILSFFAISVAINIYTNLDAIMLGFLCDDTQVGIYHAATRIRSILLTVITSLGTVLLPRLSYCINNKSEFYRLIRKSFQFTLFASIPLALFFIVFARPTILILSGESFLGGVPVLQIIMPTLVLVGLSNVTGIQMLTPMGKEKQLCYSVLLGALIDFALNLVLILRYQAVGATIATVFAELFVLIYQAVYLRETLAEMKREIHFRNSLVSALLSIVVAIVVDTVVPISNELFKIVIIAVVFGSLYLFLMLLRKDEIALVCLNYAKSIVSKLAFKTRKTRKTK